jgi:hypothetical protein
MTATARSTARARSTRWSSGRTTTATAPQARSCSRAARPRATCCWGDCDDGAADISPLALEVCDGLDNDCDGQVDPPDSGGAETWAPDEDGDGWGAGAPVAGCEGPAGYGLQGDCDDEAPAVHPAAHELCVNGLDDDCDGGTDDVCDLESVSIRIVTGDVPVTGMASGDLDGDGLPDLVFSAGSPDHLSRIATGVARGLYEVPGTWQVEGGLDLLLGDMDLDGQLDLWFSYGSTIYLFQGPIDGDRDHSMAWATPDLALVVTAATLADLEGDGHQDLVFSSTHIFGPGGLGVVPAPVPAGLSYTPIVVASDSVMPEELLPLGELDGDGADEVMFVGEAVGGTRVLSGAALLTQAALEDTVWLELSDRAMCALDPDGSGVRQPVVAADGLIGVFEL